jgi:nitroreductase
MNFTEFLAARRSVRSYTSAPVDDATVDALLRAAVQAPSAMNAQPWAFAIVQDAARLARWSERAKALILEGIQAEPKARHYAELLRDPSFNIFYDAGTLVVIGVTERSAYSDADCWLAAENLMLAACDAGLGTCCIGFALPLLNTAALKEELGFPQSGAVVAAVIVGHPQGAPPPVARKAPRVLSWIR